VTNSLATIKNIFYQGFLRGMVTINYRFYKVREVNEKVAYLPGQLNSSTV